MADPTEHHVSRDPFAGTAFAQAKAIRDGKRIDKAQNSGKGYVAGQLSSGTTRTFSVAKQQLPINQAKDGAVVATPSTLNSKARYEACISPTRESIRVIPHNTQRRDHLINTTPIDSSTKVVVRRTLQGCIAKLKHDQAQAAIPPVTVPVVVRPLPEKPQDKPALVIDYAIPTPRFYTRDGRPVY